MLTTETKRKIDNLRDTLVGKIPVPSQQVELITLGLIYKFMSDIDEQNLELGAKDSFFNGKYKQYAWSHIIDRSLSGQERTVLFAEGLERMASNPNLPQLFRDIFKGAYLPFKDPVVLDHFLKGVNELGYTHSEELGNAFEYLLSVMGSQGDAGQFRTPRHVIDFLVKAVNPKKEDTILDPACGTAGFLISAYKHILDENTKKGGHPGSALSSTDRKKLTQNFQGYDISHDMVRLSLANMYLHNFPEPKIFEYDTLSDDTRWDHTFDCILANPPFMSPRGGIRPHNRFSVQSKRSEVLFVDYIAEHLNPNGKAGVIVPEGIVFQNGTTYKQLRKMLVEENYLWAVVSLPSGAFNPYSGVKTSILFFDKALAKKTDDILFVDIEKDGYGLGAQRRALCTDVENPAWCPEHSDLPKALNTINAFKEYVRGSYQGGNMYIDFYIRDKEQQENGQLWSAFYENATFVNKKFIKEDDNYSLNASKYKKLDKIYDGNWPLVELNDVAEIEYGTRIVKGREEGTKYPVYGGGGITFYADNFNREDRVVISRFGVSEECSRFVQGKFFLNDSGLTVKVKDETQLDEKYLNAILLNSTEEIYKHARGHAQKNLDVKSFSKMKFPLPPLEVQKEIVAELESYQKIIDGARQIIDNYKPSITINPEWDMVPLDSITTIRSGYAFKSSDLKSAKDENSLPVVKIGNLAHRDFLKLDGIQYHTYFKQHDDYLIHKDDILIAMTGATVGKVSVSPKSQLLLNQRVGMVKTKDDNTISKRFLRYCLFSDRFYNYCQNTAGGGAQGNISPSQISKFEIPLPSKKVQEQVVQKIDNELKHVDSAREMVDLFENKIKEKISEVWGDKE